MASLKFSALLTEARGKLGGVYFQRTRSGYSVKNITRSRKRIITDAQVSKLIFTNKIAAWQNLSAVEKAYYANLAPKGLSGYNYYLSLPYVSPIEIEMLAVQTDFSFAEIAAGTVKEIMPAGGGGVQNIPISVRVFGSVGATPFLIADILFKLQDTDNIDLCSLDLFQSDLTNISRVVDFLLEYFSSTGITFSRNPSAGLQAFFGNYDSGGSGSATVLVLYAPVTVT